MHKRETYLVTLERPSGLTVDDIACSIRVMTATKFTIAVANIDVHRATQARATKLLSKFSLSKTKLNNDQSQSD